MSHRNAKLTAVGRIGIVSQIEEGYSQAEVARRMCLSRATVNKWWRRYREEGVAGLEDRSSRPKRVAHALSEELIEAICRLRREMGVGPHFLASELHMARSTIYGVLRRCGLSVLSHMERTTRTVIRYERERPGELVHLDVKKVGRIPDGGGKRFDPGFKETGAGRHRRGTRGGFEYVHVAVDDHSRFAYAEVLSDEKAETTAGFLMRAWLAFARVGVRIERILTDNGGNYRSGPFRQLADAEGIGLRRTRPYRPQTNGKAEAFNKTLQREWAYRKRYTSNAERLAALQPFLDRYNYSRPHTSLGCRPPASRL